MSAAALALVIAAGPSFDLPDYRGSHYTPAAAEFLTCVAERESSGRWKADGPYGIPRVGRQACRQSTAIRPDGSGVCHGESIAKEART